MSQNKSGLKKDSFNAEVSGGRHMDWIWLSDPFGLHDMMRSFLN